ncbi:MAG: galactonate dehydratase [Victivallales bacterium]|jgi:galactonate dehydratase|nr:galactonate dehydratase [Victivallales bacterium]
MRITQVQPLVCHCYRTNWVFVKVTTDEGLHGWGEATLEYREPALAKAIRGMERHLLGRDPHEIESIWHECYRGTYFRGGPIGMSALSGVEMALWDLKGKALGVPVYQLLGGKVRDRVPCYANGWFSPAKTPEEFAEKAKAAVARGFSGLKWDPFGKAYLTISKAELRQALRCVEAVVEAVGDHVEILVEAHGRFNVATAVRIGRALENYDIAWYEEPVPPDNLEALAEVKQRIRVPVAAGERIYSRWDYQRFFALRCADFAQPDPSHVGGIGEVKKIAAQAEANHIAVCPHNPSGPVANAVSLQLAACIPNFHLLETMALDVPWRADICDEHIVFADGLMSVPDRPGLGIELNEEAIAEHPYEPHDLRHYRGDLTDIRPPDAVPWYKEA